MRRLAEQAAILVRDVRFPDVNRIAGPETNKGVLRSRVDAEAIRSPVLSLLPA